MSIALIAVLAAPQQTATLSTEISYESIKMEGNVYMKVTHVAAGGTNGSDTTLTRSQLSGAAEIPEEDDEHNTYTGMVSVVGEQTSSVSVASQNLVPLTDINSATTNLPNGSKSLNSYMKYEFKVVNTGEKNIRAMVDVNFKNGNSDEGWYYHNLLADYKTLKTSSDTSNYSEMDGCIDILADGNTSSKAGGYAVGSGRFLVWVTINNTGLDVESTVVSIKLTLLGETADNAYDGTDLHKGQYIDLDMRGDSATETYEVLSIRGYNVKLMALDNYGSSVIWNNLDSAMTNWYNSCKNPAKGAIVPQYIRRYTYKPYDYANAAYTFKLEGLLQDYGIDLVGKSNVGNRYAFAAGLEDVYGIISSGGSKMEYTATGSSLRTVFWQTTGHLDDEVWLNSAVQGGGYWAVHGHGESLSSEFATLTKSVRPVFVIDLNHDQITYTNSSTTNTTITTLQKGDIVEIDTDGDNTAERYRVIKVLSDNTAEFMAMESPTNIKYWNGNISYKAFSDDIYNAYGVKPSDKNYVKYDGSTIDTYLNSTWYGSRSDTFKAAVFAQDVVQRAISSTNGLEEPPANPNSDKYKRWRYRFSGLGTIYGLTRVAYNNVGSRYVYTMSVEDIYDYLGKSFDSGGGYIDRAAVNDLFWDNTTGETGAIWLMDTGTDYDKATKTRTDVKTVLGSNYSTEGSCFISWASATDYTLQVRPVFVLQLGLIPITLISSEPNS